MTAKKQADFDEALTQIKKEFQRILGSWDRINSRDYMGARGLTLFMDHYFEDYIQKKELYKVWRQTNLSERSLPVLLDKVVKEIPEREPRTKPPDPHLANLVDHIQKKPDRILDRLKNPGSYDQVETDKIFKGVWNWFVDTYRPELIEALANAILNWRSATQDSTRRHRQYIRSYSPERKRIMEIIEDTDNPAKAHYWVVLKALDKEIDVTTRDVIFQGWKDEHGVSRWSNIRCRKKAKVRRLFQQFLSKCRRDIKGQVQIKVGKATPVKLPVAKAIKTV